MLSSGDGWAYVPDMNQHVDIARPARRLPAKDDFTRAKADWAAGEDIDHVVMAQWLLTWGKPGRKDFAEWLHDQDG